MAAKRWQVYGLRETYPEIGEYDFKIVLNPRFYKSGHDFRVEVVDSDGKPAPFKYEIWGRKINVKFVVTSNVSDGVSRADIFRGDQNVGRVTWWVIK